MLVMIILIILSVVFLIGAIIYSNYKKQNYNNKLSKQVHKRWNKKSNKTMADILDIQIKDCFVKVGNRYSCVLELGNIDYHMLSDDEQETIENVLIQTALSIDYPIQFYNTTETIDTSKIINMMRENKLESYQANRYKQHMINYLQSLMENRNISVVKNYAIISYDGLYEDASTELIRHCNSFKSNLLRAKIQTEVLEESDLYNLFFRELNKNSKVKLNLIKEGGENIYVRKAQKIKKEKK